MFKIIFFISLQNYHAPLPHCRQVVACDGCIEISFIVSHLDFQVVTVA